MKRGKYRQIIPNPHQSDIDSGLIKEILKQAGISEDEWLKA
jgi:predicted RNA binding protein YcfA (HicA-like mRNA interferase family)